MSEKSTVSVGLDNDHLDILQALAEIDACTLGDEIRNAINNYITERTKRTSAKNKIAAKIAKDKKKRDLQLRQLFGHS